VAKIKSNIKKPTTAGSPHPARVFHALLLTCMQQDVTENNIKKLEKQLKVTDYTSAHEQQQLIQKTNNIVGCIQDNHCKTLHQTLANYVFAQGLSTADIRFAAISQITDINSKEMQEIFAEQYNGIFERPVNLRSVEECAEEILNICNIYPLKTLAKDGDTHLAEDSDRNTLIEYFGLHKKPAIEFARDLLSQYRSFDALFNAYFNYIPNKLVDEKCGEIRYEPGQDFKKEMLRQYVFAHSPQTIMDIMNDLHRTPPQNPIRLDMRQNGQWWLLSLKINFAGQAALKRLAKKSTKKKNQEPKPLSAEKRRQMQLEREKRMQEAALRRKEESVQTLSEQYNKTLSTTGNLLNKIHEAKAPMPKTAHLKFRTPQPDTSELEAYGFWLKRKTIAQNKINTALDDTLTSHRENQALTFEQSMA
jgi:hypothetical protein